MVLPACVFASGDVPGDDADAHALKLHRKVGGEGPIVISIFYLGFFL
jgi:hypothetical protein